MTGNVWLGIMAFPALFVLIALRVPIGIAMLVIGAGGSALVYGSVTPVLAQFKSLAYESVGIYTLSVVPLFLLMGQFATMGGLSRALFSAADAAVGHRRGGVALATIAGCAGFGAICGSSLATAAAIGRVALPELKAAGYSSAFASGALAAGGTLGILIPPSIILVIFAALTEQNVADLFLAALVPGLIAIAGYMAVVAVLARLNPGEAGALRAKPARRDRVAAVLRAWPAGIIFLLVIGGIYTGLFSPTEAAAIGAAATGLAAVLGKALDLAGLRDALLATASTTAMIFLILIGAAALNGFLALSQLPQALVAGVDLLDLHPMAVLAIILAVHLVLAIFMDELAMILLTVPLVYPLMLSLDFGLTPHQVAIWFGILMLTVVEVGLILPPLGMNLLVIASLDREARLPALYRGVLPFLASDAARIVLLAAVPAISIFLV